MSKKTQNIYSAIEKLNNLQNQLADFNKIEQNRQLQDIEFQMSQELKNLRFWIDSLYSYNGKSTSYAKKTASRENGKKGGRPPKSVTLAKRKIAQLELEIPELEHNLQMSDSPDERNCLEAEIINKKAELLDLNNALRL